jgi:hypothetical protein
MMTGRAHRVFLAFVLVEVVALGSLLVWGRGEAARRQRSEVPARQALVGALELTDLAIWTEARYTRHPTQADLFSAFQDLPSSLEHFPAGSIVPPAGVESLVSDAGN